LPTNSYSTNKIVKIFVKKKIVKIIRSGTIICLYFIYRWWLISYKFLLYLTNFWINKMTIIIRNTYATKLKLNHYIRPNNFYIFKLLNLCAKIYFVFIFPERKIYIFCFFLLIKQFIYVILIHWVNATVVLEQHRTVTWIPEKHGEGRKHPHRRLRSDQLPQRISNRFPRRR